MRTITTEVGSGPIKAVTTVELVGSYTEDEIDNSTKLDLGERIAVPIPQNDNITSGLDGRREKTTDLNLKSGDVPNGAIINTVDNGPDLNSANDNDVLAGDNIANSPKANPLKEMFERGDLGINEIENRHHWFDAERFKTVHADARGEPDNSNDNWRELLLEFYEGFFDNIVTSTSADDGLVLNDDMEFEDSNTPTDYEAVDFSGWQPTKDLAPHLRVLFAQQVVDLMLDVLGSDYDVLCAAIERSWTNQQIGETEGYTNRASASACGKGKLRSALRNLSRFYRSLDRIEERGDRPQDAWPLVGTLNWVPVRYGPERYRTRDLAFMNQAPGPIRKWREDFKIAA
jgi:hypothetical protein